MKAIDVIIKDLKIILSDKKALATMILMPIILTSILSVALKGSFSASTNIDSINIGIVKNYDIQKDTDKFTNVLTNGMLSKNIPNESSKQISEAISKIDVEKIFFQDFLGNKDINKIVKYSILEENQALQLLKEGRISAVVLLPENFIYDMYTNFLTPFRNKVEVKVITHPDKQMSGQIIEEIMKAFSDTVSSIVINKNVFTETGLEFNIDRVYEDVQLIFDKSTENGNTLRINIIYDKIDGKEPVSSFSYYSAAMTTMFILFAAGIGAKSLLEEKDNLTYQRMVIAGTSKWKILTGKFFTIFMIVLIQILTMIEYTTTVLGVEWGNLYYVLAINISVAISVAGLGIMLAALTYKIGNYKAANIFEGAIIQVMALLGGSFIPINIMPKFMQILSNFTINGLGLKSYLKIMMGYGVNEIIIPLLILITLGMVFTVISIVILKKEEGGQYVKHINAKSHEIA